MGVKTSKKSTEKARSTKTGGRKPTTKLEIAALRTQLAAFETTVKQLLLNPPAPMYVPMPYPCPEVLKPWWMQPTPFLPIYPSYPVVPYSPYIPMTPVYPQPFWMIPTHPDLGPIYPLYCGDSTQTLIGISTTVCDTDPFAQLSTGLQLTAVDDAWTVRNNTSFNPTSSANYNASSVSAHAASIGFCGTVFDSTLS